jgi:hypothetical protein
MLSLLALTAAITVAPAAPAHAAGAPWCESGASIFVCTTPNSVLAASWTIYRVWDRTTVTVPGTSSYVRDTCRGGTQVQVNYNYYSGGVLTPSPAVGFVCNAGPWP